MSVPAPPRIRLHTPLRDIHRAVLLWYRTHGRTLPWRNIANPYHVLVSEIMLQQTQVARVAEKFPQWIAAFPSIRVLAQASQRAVLTAWSGMGYNRRALNLHDAAKRIVGDYRGRIPADVNQLAGLPGFGRYTASAVACFGFQQRVAIVDVNVRRVLSRLVKKQRHESDILPAAECWTIAEALLPPRAYYNWNQALMDLGAMVCTAAAPHCLACPIRSYCPSSVGMKPRPRSAASATRETPRRIFRGRVIELLRAEDGTAVKGFVEIGKHLRNDFTSAQHPWLMDILRTLQSDGMIRVEARQRTVALDAFKGNPVSLKVRLA